MSEKITAALVRMGSPHLLEAHEIQGLNLDKILPAVQWLHIQIEEMYQRFGDRYRRHLLQLYRKWYPGSYQAVQQQVKQLIEESISTEQDDEPICIQSDDVIRLHQLLTDTERQLNALEVTENDLMESVCREQTQYDSIQQEIQTLEQKYSDKKKFIHEIDYKLCERTRLETECASFRQRCKVQLKEIKLKISDCKLKLEDHKMLDRSPEMHEALSKLSLDNQKLLQEHERLKSEHYKFKHKLYEFPSKTELVQYQKRFMELYLELETESEEIRQLYIHYNSLQSLQSQMLKEAKLIDSITDNYLNARHSKVNQDRFLDQITNWMKIANENLQVIDLKRQDEVKVVDSDSNRLNYLLTLKRESSLLEKKIALSLKNNKNS